MSLWLRTFSTVFSKTVFFTSLKKSFSNLFVACVLHLAFRSIKALSHALCSNLITRCTFLRINSCFHVCFRAWLYTTYFFGCWDLAPTCSPCWPSSPLPWNSTCCACYEAPLTNPDPFWVCSHSWFSRLL